ncbi:undecaprenyldiphospho-muramoylpentapeptide beta-N-acetylglucosaminyltransferase [Bacteroidota bacterium]
MGLQQKNKHIIICGGGTGGHIFPAISIANALKEIDPDVDLLFVGARNKIEMTVVPEAGYMIKGLPISAFHRSLSFKNILFIFKLIKSLFLAGKIIKQFKPDVVLGVGGFASGPVMKMATWKKIPSFIQEQNSFPGVTNRLLAKKAEKIFVAYDQMEKYFQADKIVFTGNPVRQDLENIENLKNEAIEYFEFNKSKKTIFFFGGSQGARIINQSIISKIDLIKKSDVQIIWQTGKFFFEKAKQIIKEKEIININIFEFISRMDLAYSIADLVVCRAGAGTISELCLTGKPAILVPFALAAGDHQKKNAMALVEKGAAKMLYEKQAEENLINDAIEIIKDEKQLGRMADNIIKLKKENSAKNIAKQILNFIEKKD